MRPSDENVEQTPRDRTGILITPRVPADDCGVSASYVILSRMSDYGSTSPFVLTPFFQVYLFIRIRNIE